MADLEPVEVVCSCPGTPHPIDTVYLYPVVDVRIGSAAMAAMQVATASLPDMQAELSAAFMHQGIRDWTLTGEDGQPLPITPANIDSRLTWAKGGLDVANRASDLYQEDVLGPLGVSASKPSRSGRTAPSTSRNRRNGHAPASLRSVKPSSPVPSEDGTVSVAQGL